MSKFNPNLELPRSPEWPALRDKWIRDHPTCAACGSTKFVQAHHKVPVHVARSMELDPTNLITLCQDNSGPTPASKPNKCHFEVGHLGNWFNWNRKVDKAASDLLQQHYRYTPGTPVPPHVADVQEAVPNGQNPAMSASGEPTELAPASTFHRPLRR